MQKPNLSFWQIWNMTIGFLGIQIGFELQNNNTSRIFQTLGADVDALPILWIAGPLTGLLVQPIVGYFSDRTWTPLGRRRPYFMVGAILASLALIAMPNAGFLWMAAGLLWIKDAALNITMEPTRAFVGDNLSEEQRPTGYAMQSFFIGVGAVGAAALPWLLTKFLGVSNEAVNGRVPWSVHLSYYVGAFSLFVAVMWTVLKSKEYSPEELAAFEKARMEDWGVDIAPEQAPVAGNVYARNGMIWLVIGGLIAAFVAAARAEARPEVLNFLGGIDFRKEMYVLAALVAGYGAIQLVAGLMQRGGGKQNGFQEVIEDMYRMPTTMRQLAIVQFFSWFAMFAMWIYGNGAVAEHYFNSPDPQSQGFQDGSSWWSLMSSVRNGAAALAAIGIIWLSRNLDSRRVHALALAIGAAGFAIMFMMSDPNTIWISMIMVGVAWASIVAVPYAILASSVPMRKMGIYMGIFNIFIVVPQLVAATLLGFLLSSFFDSKPIYAMAIAGTSFAFGSLATFFIRLPSDEAVSN